MLAIKRLPIVTSDHRGINMVDLMMWLVIAALLLATAIQSIGYYQKNANVYVMKEEANVVASRVMAESADRGVIDDRTLDAIVADENAARNKDSIIVSWGEASSASAAAPSNDNSGFELASAATATASAGEAYFIKITNTAVPDADVVYFLEDTANYSSGVHLIEKDALGAGTGAPEGNSVNGQCYTGQWRATYYDNYDYEDAPTVDRCENGDSINYIWELGQPHPSLPSDYFAVRWEKEITIPETADYTFNIHGDDHVYVTLDGVRILSATWEQGVVKTINIPAGKHKLMVEMADGVSGARIGFNYELAK